MIVFFLPRRQWFKVYMFWCAVIVCFGVQGGSVCKGMEIRAEQRLLCVWSYGGMKLEWLFWAWWREPLLLPSKVAPGVTSLWPWVLAMCVYLPKCHGNLVSITWKHPKYVFNFANSSLKNQRIEWRKQKLKTNPNTPFCRGTHQFWVMGHENKVMGDGKHEIQTAP